MTIKELKMNGLSVKISNMYLIIKKIVLLLHSFLQCMEIERAKNNNHSNNTSVFLIV